MTVIGYFTANQTTTIYKEMNNKGAYYSRLQATQKVDVIQEMLGGVWLQVATNGGYVEKRYGVYVPLTPPPPPPPPVPVPTEADFTVTVNKHLNITTVQIEGDESNPINIVINGRVVN